MTGAGCCSGSTVQVVLSVRRLRLRSTQAGKVAMLIGFGDSVLGGGAFGLSLTSGEDGTDG